MRGQHFYSQRTDALPSSLLFEIFIVCCLKERCGTRAHRGVENCCSSGGQLSANKIPLAKHYSFVMITLAAVDHRGFIKVDEVDGRSPVERAAATFVPGVSLMSLNVRYLSKIPSNSSDNQGSVLDVVRMAEWMLEINCSLRSPYFSAYRCRNLLEKLPVFRSVLGFLKDSLDSNRLVVQPD